MANSTDRRVLQTEYMKKFNRKNFGISLYPEYVNYIEDTLMELRKEATALRAEIAFREKEAKKEKIASLKENLTDDSIKPIKKTKKEKS